MPGWVHRDSRLSARVAAGHARARSGAWAGASAARADELRAHFIDVCRVAAELHGEVGNPSESWRAIYISPWASTERSWAAAVLVRPIEMLAQSVRGALSAPEHQTQASSDADAGGWPVVVGVAVVVVAGGALVGYAAAQALQIVDRQLQRREASRRLLQEQEHVRELVERHAEREAVRGRALPLDAATKAAIAAAERQQKELIRREPALESGIPWGSSGRWAALLPAVAIAAAVALSSE